MGPTNAFQDSETTEVIEEAPVTFMDRIRYGDFANELGWFKRNLKRAGLREAFRVVIYNTRWRIGYFIGPFHHACDTPDCSACLD